MPFFLSFFFSFFKNVFTLRVPLIHLKLGLRYTIGCCNSVTDAELSLKVLCLVAILIHLLAATFCTNIAVGCSLMHFTQKLDIS